MNYLKHSVLLLFILSFLAGSASATSYYVAANGSDSNDGKSQSTPWLHAPGMPAFTGSYSASAGDQIIFRGGDTWHFGNSSQSPYVGGTSWTFSHSGASGNPIYIGTDHNWYAGSSYARPIFNGDDPVTTSTVSSCKYDYNNVNVVLLGGDSHIRFDDIEFTGFCYSGTSDPNAGFVNFGGTDAIIEHCYFHGFTIQSNLQYDEQVAIHGSGTGFKGDSTNQCLYNVFDNSDGSYGTTGTYPNGKATLEAIQNACGIVAYNVFRRVSNGVVGTSISLHDNLFVDLYEPQGSVHGNIWNSNNDGLVNVGSQSFYNNVFHDINEGVSVWLMPTPVGYIFNNIEWNNSNSVNCYVIGGSSSATIYFYNNTSDAPCALRALNNGSDPVWRGTVHLANNHYIGYSSASLPNTYICDSGATCSWVDDDPTSEIFQSESVANSQGYSRSNMYAPTSGSGATVGIAGNYANLCGNFSPDSALCKGTSQSVSEQSDEGGKVAVSPAITMVSRAASGAGAWNSGAYYFGGVSSSNPNPPTSLSATVQ
ncbi:MAG TPA: hypothetical protein VGH37_12235 [Candidatus Acidoferrum sp.]|jgi:hypothetical protein